MLRAALLGLCAGAALPVTAAGQTSMYARAGMTVSSDIVRDVILAPVTTRPGLAPTLFAGADFAVSPRYRFGIEASAATASLTTRTPSQPNSGIDQGRIWTVGALLNMSGTLASQVGWRAGLGLLHYSGPGDAGIFSEGGTTKALFGVGVDYQLKSGRTWHPVVSARYDYHRFVTKAMRTQGFGLEQGVQRISLSVGLVRGTP